MLKQLLLCLMVLTVGTNAARAQQFDQYFTDATLRLDYIFAGNAERQDIYLDEMLRTERWAGRRNRLSETLLEGNGKLTVRDHETKQIIYTWTFSTLFQEWLQEDEAKTLKRAFEASYNVPFPKSVIDIHIALKDNRNRVIAEASHTVDPRDILIRKLHGTGIPHHYVWKGMQGETVAKPRYSRTYIPTPYNPDEGVNYADCIDLAIVAEGYTEAEMGKFYADCERAVEALFENEPFKSLKERFNVVAVAAPSLQSGPSVPHRDIWVNTACDTHYDTFYSDRYLTSQSLHHIYDLLADVPFEHIMVLVNTDTYGGGGIYNQITFATSDHPTFKQVFVHEFGHSYGGLADEYAYDDMDTVWYPSDTEPWEPNITTLRDFNSKWADMMSEGTPIPTPLDPDVPDYRSIKDSDTDAWKRLNDCVQRVGVFEGAGYQTKGCYRPAQECRMKINEVRDFCPVCTRAIRRITDFYTK